MRPLERSLEKLDDVRRKKLSEMIMGSEVSTSTASSSGLLNIGTLSEQQLSSLLIFGGFFILDPYILWYASHSPNFWWEWAFFGGELMLRASIFFPSLC